MTAEWPSRRIRLISSLSRRILLACCGLAPVQSITCCICGVLPLPPLLLLLPPAPWLKASAPRAASALVRSPPAPPPPLPPLAPVLIPAAGSSKSSSSKDAARPASMPFAASLLRSRWPAERKAANALCTSGSAASLLLLLLLFSVLSPRGGICCMRAEGTVARLL